MIEAFIKWFEANQHKLAERGMVVSTHRNKKLRHPDFFTSAVAEVETDKLIGSLIYYRTGQYDINIFKNSGDDLKEVFLEVHEPATESELLALLEYTFDRIYAYKP